MNLHAKEIGRLLSKLASHDLPLSEVAELVQAQIDLIEKEVRNKAIKDAEMVVQEMRGSGESDLRCVAANVRTLLKP